MRPVFAKTSLWWDTSLGERKPGWAFPWVWGLILDRTGWSVVQCTSDGLAGCWTPTTNPRSSKTLRAQLLDWIVTVCRFPDHRQSLVWPKQGFKLVHHSIEKNKDACRPKTVNLDTCSRFKSYWCIFSLLVQEVNSVDAVFFLKDDLRYVWS
jgi:hypothetical protein